MLGPLRFCCHVKPTYHASLAFCNYSLTKVINDLASRLYYSKDSKDCCKDIAQTTGRKVEPWPKPDPPPPSWRVECPQEPQPPHYDPYRIKVPDVVVPPLPPSDVKLSGVVHTSSDQHGPTQEQRMHRFPTQQGYPSTQQQEKEEPEDASFFGLIKGFFGKFKGKEGKEGGEGDARMNDSRDIHQWLYL